MDTLQPVKRLWLLIASEKKEIASIYFYAIMSGLVQLSVPLGIQAIISFVLGASMVTSIFVLIVLVVTGVFLVGVFQMNQMKIIEKIQQRIFANYSFALAENIPRFDLKKTDKYYLPEKSNRFFDIMNIQKGFSKLLLDIPVALIQIIFGLLLLSFYHPLFIGFAIILIIILWITGVLYSRKGIITAMQESNYKYAVASWLEEMARVIKSFKFSQGSHLNLKKTDKEVSGYLLSRTSHFKVLVFQYKTLIFFKVIITAALLSIGSYLLLNQQLNVGEFIAAEIVILMVINAVEKLIVNLDSVYDVITGLEKLSSVIELPLEPSGNLHLNTDKNGLHLEMKDVSFEFEKNETILHKINLNIAPFNTVCISGPDNSGKSTLLKLLSGSYNDFSGSILINKIPIGNYSLEKFRENTGMFLNNQDLFSGTLWENISMGLEDVKIDEITSLAYELGIEDTFTQLSEGFETRIEPIGHKLSSTLVRKILLLRAFANEPSLLLLESPWQGLDKITTKKIKQYILKKKSKATIIIVCNDQSFAGECDIKIELVNGTINNLQTNK